MPSPIHIIAPVVGGAIGYGIAVAHAATAIKAGQPLPSFDGYQKAGSGIGAGIGLAVGLITEPPFR